MTLSLSTFCSSQIIAERAELLSFIVPRPLFVFRENGPQFVLLSQLPPSCGYKPYNRAPTTSFATCVAFNGLFKTRTELQPVLLAEGDSTLVVFLTARFSALATQVQKGYFLIQGLAERAEKLTSNVPRPPSVVRENGPQFAPSPQLPPPSGQ